MRKSSRFLWLHGAMVLSAVIGCKSNSCCSGNNCGTPTGGSPAVAGVPYNGTTTMYQGGTAVPYGNTSGSQSYMPPSSSMAAPPTGATSFAPPTTSTTTYPNLGGPH